MHVFGVWEEAQVLEGTHKDRPQQAIENSTLVETFRLVNRNTTDLYFIYLCIFLLWFKTISLTISKKISSIYL